MSLNVLDVFHPKNISFTWWCKKQLL